MSHKLFLPVMCGQRCFVCVVQTTQLRKKHFFFLWLSMRLVCGVQTFYYFSLSTAVHKYTLSLWCSDIITKFYSFLYFSYCFLRTKVFQKQTVYVGTWIKIESYMYFYILYMLIIHKAKRTCLSE